MFDVRSQRVFADHNISTHYCSGDTGDLGNGDRDIHTDDHSTTDYDCLGYTHCVTLRHSHPTYADTGGNLNASAECRTALFL